MSIESKKLAYGKHYMSDKYKETKRRYRQSEVYKKNQLAAREKNKDKLLRKRYGITFKQLDIMIESQNNLCYICGKIECRIRSNGKSRELSVDHNHETGQVRDLLCSKCNLVVGNCDESIEILLKTIEYIKKWNK